jgi:hypothetical protein
MDKEPMAVLLCGPITGQTEVDKKLFKSYEERLVNAGINAFNLIEGVEEYYEKRPLPDPPEDISFSQANWRLLYNFNYYFSAIANCQAVYLIPGWNTTPISLTIALAAQKFGLKFIRHLKGKLVAIKSFNLVLRNSEGVSETEFPADDPEPEDISEEDLAKLTQDIPEEAGGRQVNRPVNEKVADASDSAVDALGDWFKEQLEKPI